MNKADHKFYREKRQEINSSARQTLGPLFSFRAPANNPIHIPKRKKRK
jgi:hypothetical protein